MPLSEESDPFARRHLPDQRRRNCAALERFRLELCRGKLCGRAGARRLPPISTTTAPGQHHRPAPPRRQRSKARAAAHTPRRLPWLFLLPHLPALLLPRPCPAAAPTMTAAACPICPAWAVSACPMSSGPPARSPARAAPSSRTPADLMTPAALLPAPLPDLPTTPAASPPAPRRQPNARGVRFST